MPGDIVEREGAQELIPARPRRYEGQVMSNRQGTQRGEASAERWDWLFWGRGREELWGVWEQSSPAGPNFAESGKRSRSWLRGVAGEKPSGPDGAWEAVTGVGEVGECRGVEAVAAFGDVMGQGVPGNPRSKADTVQ